MLLQRSLGHIEIIEQEKLPVGDKLRKAMVVHIEYLLNERSGFEMMIKPEQIFSSEQLGEIFQLRNDYEECFNQLIVGGIEAGVFDAVDIKIV